MVKDKLGTRMKENYENRSKNYLTRRMPVIIRIDGCHFHTFCKKFEKPFDKLFATAMQQTTKYLCENIQGVKLGYTQSDEISLLLVDYTNLDTDAWFDYNVQKVCSVSASLATLAFNRFFNELVSKEFHIASAEYYTPHYNASKIGATFDSRCFNIPKEEVANYFIWRQQDAIRNSKSALGQSFYNQKQLNGLNADQVVNKVISEKSIDWSKFAGEQKWGSVVKKIDLDNGKTEWSIVTDPALFIDNRTYIEDLIK